MPSWKKVIVSGSDASLNSLNITTTLTASGLNYPTTDNGEESYIQTDGSGNLSFQYVKTIYEEIYNGEATSIIKGTPVYVSGSVGAASVVYRADAGDPTKMPVIYITADTINSAGTGRGIALGLIKGVDTTGYLAGTEIYLAVGGGWTSTRPTGSAIVQVLGYITKEGVGGQGVILNPGPNSIPNLTSGSVWVGNSNSIPIAVTTSSLNVLSAQTASYVNPLNQNVIITGSLSATSFTGSLQGTASFAKSASTFYYELANVDTDVPPPSRLPLTFIQTSSVDRGGYTNAWYNGNLTYDWDNSTLYAPYYRSSFVTGEGVVAFFGTASAALTAVTASYFNAAVVTTGSGTDFSLYSTSPMAGNSGTRLPLSGSISFGYQAGFNSSASVYVNLLGWRAGYQTNDVSYSNFLGNSAGSGANNAEQSQFIGYRAGYLSTGANNSVFIGYLTGQQQASASYSTIIGHASGRSGSWGALGRNNIIIGTNISLPTGYANYANIGGVLFISGTYGTTSGNNSIGSQENGRIGIGIVNPSASLHITNTSNANSFLVEDSINPDSSPFVIDNMGNVGIGMATLTTSTKVDILYTGSDTGVLIRGGGSVLDSTPLKLWDIGTAINNRNIIEFGHNSTYVTASRIYSTNPSPNATTGGKLVLETTSDNVGTFNTNQLVLSNNGNVGIGISAPTRRFEVVTGSTTAYFDLQNTSGPLAAVVTSDFTKLARFNASDGTNSISVGLRSSAETDSPGFGEQTDTFIYANSNANGLNIINASGTGTADYIKFFAGKVATETPSMIIIGSGSSKGNVGIGTTTPNAKLDVSGSTIISGSLTTTSSVAFKAYTSPTSFVGTPVGYLAFDSVGNILTVAGITATPAGTTTQLQYNNAGVLAGTSAITFDGTTLVATGSFTGSFTGSLQITDNIRINNSLYTTTVITANIGSTTIYSVATSSYDGAWFEYIARSGSSARAGQLMSIWSGSVVNFTETTTTDFGSTAGLLLGVYIVNGDMSLTASADTDGWNIKTIVRSI